MNSYRRYAFLSFLDLISCAFGAAVLIFVISALGGEKNAGSESPDVMLFFAKHVSGTAPEVQFEVRDPMGFIFRTTGDMPEGTRRFASPAGNASGAYLVIPQPAAGDWTVRLFWVDGYMKQNAVFELESFSPVQKPNDRISQRAELSARQRFSEELKIKIQR